MGDCVCECGGKLVNTLHFLQKLWYQGRGFLGAHFTEIDLIKFREHYIMHGITVWLTFLVIGCLRILNYLNNVGIIVYTLVMF